MNRTLFTNHIACALRNIVPLRSSCPQTAGPLLSHRLRRTGLWAALLVGLLAAKADAAPTYVLGTNGTLWREHGNYTRRSEVDANVTSFQPLDDSMVLVLGTNGFLWIEDGNYKNRSFVDANVAAFHATD